MITTNQRIRRKLGKLIALFGICLAITACSSPSSRRNGGSGWENFKKKQFAQSSTQAQGFATNR